MRPLKLCLMFCLLGALAGPALAIGIPFSQGYNGALYWHIVNYEDSTVYDYNGGFLADGVTPITTGVAYPAGLVKVLSPGIALQPGENSWGIFYVSQIVTAEVSGPNGITPGSGAVTLYDNGTSAYDVTGIFYGSKDVTVTFDSPTETTVESSGAQYEIFVQPKGTFDPSALTGTPSLGAIARVDLNEFPTIGYDGTGTNTLLPGTSLVITGTSQPGMVASEFSSTFDSSLIDGTFGTYISVGPVTGTASLGIQNVFFDTNIFPCGGFAPVVPGTTADFRIKGTSDPTLAPWLVHSSDPVTTAIVVPEPITMFGLMLGIGGIGGYIRRRRRA